MILIGETLNGFVPAAGRAIQARDREAVQELALAQSRAGADYLDLCASSEKAGELDALLWLVEAVQEVVETPLCLDSANPAVLERAMDALHRPGLINSVSVEGRRAELLPRIAERGMSCVLLLTDRGVPSVEGRLRAFERLAELADASGLPRRRLFVDPLVLPASTHPEAFSDFAACCREIRRRDGEVHLVGGVSNVSFGLPGRRQLNRAFLPMAMAAGLDSAICDVTDEETRAAMAAARVLLGQDEMCGDYLRDWRARHSTARL